nr:MULTISPECIES: hypothetical protein [Rhizobium]
MIWQVTADRPDPGLAAAPRSMHARHYDSDYTAIVSSRSRPIRPVNVRLPDGRRHARPAQAFIALKAEKASAFGAYIASNLDRLYEAFEKTQDLTKNGDQ